MNPADYEAAGLYDPRAPGAAERLELLEWLAGRGLTIEAMVAANARGPLSALAADLALRQGPRYTLEEIAARAAIPADRLAELTLAVGLPAARDQRLFGDDMLEVSQLFARTAALFGEKPLLRVLRTVGASLSHIAEAAVSLFYVTVEGPMRARGTTERQLAEAGLRAVESISALQRMIHVCFGAHMAMAIERFRRLQLGRSVYTAEMTVGFIDLVGFTPLASRVSARDLAELIEDFETRAHDAVVAGGGRLVKLIGDEVMFVTMDARAACDIGLALVDEFAGDRAVTPRGALAAGELIIRGGDYYGPIVNLAARLAELAVPGELLVTPAVATAAGAPHLRFQPAGKRMLKGFDEPVALLTVERAAGASASGSAPAGPQ
ncbi:hypothetical protein KF840_09420 [bacterium]|nr:hypothetical protein [bacterium]